MSSACVLRVTSEYSFINLGRMAAELIVGLWLVVPTTGFEPTRADLTRFESLRLNYSATPPKSHKQVDFTCILDETHDTQERMA